MTEDWANPKAAMLTPGQRSLLQHKIHVDPAAWKQSDDAVRRLVSSPWAAALRLVEQLNPLPEDALHWWAQQPRGHVLLTAGDEGYDIGTRTSGARELGATALIPLRRLVQQPEQATVLALMPLDHLLGCGGADGLWLSDGGGCSARWRRIGSRISALFPLGYSLSDAAQSDPHRYFAEGLRVAMHDRRRLNVEDPKLERLLHQSVLDVGFWRNFLREDS